MEKLVDHLHDYVRENRLTTGEWTETIQFLTKCGQICSDIRREFILLSDKHLISGLKNQTNKLICNLLSSNDVT